MELMDSPRLKPVCLRMNRVLRFRHSTLPIPARNTNGGRPLTDRGTAPAEGIPKKATMRFQ